MSTTIILLVAVCVKPYACEESKYTYNESNHLADSLGRVAGGGEVVCALGWADTG